MDDEARDPSRGLEPHEGPGLSRVGGLVDALTDGDVAPDLPLSRPRPDDVGVRGRDGERPDRLHRLVVEHLVPVHAAVRRLVDPARGRAHVVGVRLAGDPRRRAEAIPLGTDVPPPERLVGGRIGSGLRRQRCDGRKGEDEKREKRAEGSDAHGVPRRVELDEYRKMCRASTVRRTSPADKTRRPRTAGRVEGGMMTLDMVESDLETTPARSYDVSTMQIPSITWQDVQQMPDDGNRYEAIEGSSYMTPAPTFRHQRVGHRLGKALDEVLEQPGHGVVVPAPFGVEFPATGEGVQPDLLFVSNERRGLITNAGLTGAPDLVVEILSPSTASRDRGLKLRLYERQGVREYWIVDAEENTVDVWRFAEDPQHERFAETLPVRLGTEEVGEIDLEAVFAPDL
ncbi:MAG: Uma2 family endonuclease [Gemmatimonadales bacterium]|nr:Uma2 family endonuclease [Gemmatimonadales bacterium]